MCIFSLSIHFNLHHQQLPWTIRKTMRTKRRNKKKSISSGDAFLEIKTILSMMTASNWMKKDEQTANEKKATFESELKDWARKRKVKSKKGRDQNMPGELATVEHNVLNEEIVHMWNVRATRNGSICSVTVLASKWDFKNDVWWPSWK